MGSAYHICYRHAGGLMQVLWFNPAVYFRGRGERERGVTKGGRILRENVS